jgi:hypothetical protein
VQVQQKWARDLTAWADRLTWFGVRLDIAAARYQSGDDAGAQQFDSLCLDAL